MTKSIKWTGVGCEIELDSSTSEILAVLEKLIKTGAEINE